MTSLLGNSLVGWNREALDTSAWKLLGNIATSCRENISHWNTASCIAGHPNSQYMSGTIFDKDTTYQATPVNNFEQPQTLTFRQGGNRIMVLGLYKDTYSHSCKALGIRLPSLQSFSYRQTSQQSGFLSPYSSRAISIQDTFSPQFRGYPDLITVRVAFLSAVDMQDCSWRLFRQFLEPSRPK
ncbi:hypothetical protein M569_17726 [Genlisea aurea]|uniref:Uncharacterized protein n=1 Tax=Genlisea aurea TaxID=192259 RepID=S8D358_9LAMI|nr:hypothetical protein M569_17726 [Genlisea aurea]